jgi:hypothetical protein
MRRVPMRRMRAKDPPLELYILPWTTKHAATTFESSLQSAANAVDASKSRAKEIDFTPLFLRFSAPIIRPIPLNSKRDLKADYIMTTARRHRQNAPAITFSGA